MKKRRTVIVTFLLAALLVMSVGFALVSETLTLTGNASTTVATINVKYSAGSIKDASTDAIKTASSVGATGDSTISLTAAGLSTKDQWVEATFTIVNNNGYAVKVTQPKLETTHTHFAFLVSEWGDATENNSPVDEADSTKSITLEPGKTETFTVRVTLQTDSADKLTEAFRFTFVASAGTVGVNP